MHPHQPAGRRWPALWLHAGLATGLACSGANLLNANEAQAALWTFQGTGGAGVSYNFSISNGGGESAQSGLLTGSFLLADDQSSGWLSMDGKDTTAVTATNTAFCPQGTPSATQNDVCTGDDLQAVTYKYGYLTPVSGNVQTLYFWNTYPSGNGGGDYARGLQLTIYAGSLSPSTGGAILGIASTANDNFCKQIVSGTNNATPNQLSGLVPTGCTAAKNNLYNIQGTLSSPSPAIGLGLAPLALLSVRRRKRLASANARTGLGCPASPQRLGCG